jgi:hypothetical protein
MRLVIILFFSLCQFVTKAHDHTAAAKHNRLVSFMHFDGKSKNDAYIHTQDPNDQEELVIDINDEDNDLVSARKHSQLIRSVIFQYYLQLFSGYQITCKNQFSCSQSLIIPTDRYITQRVLRI